MKPATIPTLLFILAAAPAALGWNGGSPSSRGAQQTPQVPPHAPPHGPAQSPAPRPPLHIEVLVLDATMGDGGVAPEIAHMPHLRQPPFTGYSQIALVSRTMLPLGTQEATHPLPDGDTVGVSLAWNGAKGRYSVDCTLTRAGHTSRIQFVASPGVPFFTVRSSHPDHAQIVGFIVQP